jgi:hypothetical protein
MTISGTCGNQVVGTLDELQHLLRERLTDDFGEFWLGEKGQPTLAIHTNSDLAYLHYFPASRHPCFQSVGNAGLDGEVLFKQAGQADFSMPRAAVVSVEQAYRAAADFFTSRNLPSCIKWSEL